VSTAFRLADNLVLDYVDYAVEGMRIAILARSGGGKSNLAALFAEAVLDAGCQLCVIEPIEEWYTLKSAYDSVVWAGEDGDLPLVTELPSQYVRILESGASLVLSVSTGDEYANKQFVADFLWNLYVGWKKVRRPLFLLVEEADTYAPQMWSREDRPSLSRMALLAKRGRKLGINMLVVSQRPADIHKSVISQANILFIGGFRSTQDLNSVEQLSKLLHLPIPTDEVARLEPGEFFAVTRGEITRIRAYMRKTPHGGATPELMPVRADLGDTLDGIRAAVEKEMERLRAERDELSRLRRENEALKSRIEELERQLETYKVVKEIPIEIKAAGPIEVAATAPLTQQPSQQLPEAVRKSPYPETMKVWIYLSQRMEPVTLKDLRAATGFSEDRVRRVVKYLRNKGLVKADTAHVAGVGEVIRRVTAKPV
jgi:biotin operon repressor